MAVEELEVSPALRLTRLVSVKAKAVLVASLGPYRVKVIVPVGLVPRVRGATSFTDPPATTEPLAVVESAGLAFLTTTASAAPPQPTGPVLPSLAYPTFHPRLPCLPAPKPPVGPEAPLPVP